MGIAINSLCVECLLNKHLQTARSLGDEETALAFIKAVMQIFLDAEPEDSSSRIGARINKLYMKFYGLPEDRFQAEKDESNRFVMARLDKLRSRVQQSADPVLTALQYAILGNYIDFPRWERMSASIPWTRCWNPLSNLPLTEMLMIASVRIWKAQRLCFT